MPSQSDLIYIGICYKRKISIAHHCMWQRRNKTFGIVYALFQNAILLHQTIGVKIYFNRGCIFLTNENNKIKIKWRQTFEAQHAQWILIKIENAFNGTFTGWKNVHQEFKISTSRPILLKKPVAADFCFEGLKFRFKRRSLNLCDYLWRVFSKD